MKRFWIKVARGGKDECWNWGACRGPDGYGRFRLNGETEHAHRVAWTLAFGEIPRGIFVCHTCDNPPCVNPSHLFLGTAQENTWDCIAKGRRAAQRRPGILCGSGNGRAILNDWSACGVMARWLMGYSQCQVAREFGIGHSTVFRIVNRCGWAHLFVGVEE